MLIAVKWFQNNRTSSWIIGAAIQLQRSVAPVTSGWFTTEKNRWNRICQSLLWKITIFHSAEVRSELWNRTGGATSGFPWNLREKHGQFPQIIHGLSSYFSYILCSYFMAIVAISHVQTPIWVCLRLGIINHGWWWLIRSFGKRSRLTTTMLIYWSTRRTGEGFSELTK